MGCPAVLEPVDVADVGMVQRGEDLRFASKAGQPVWVVRDRPAQNLQRNVTIELRVARAIDLAHAAGAERAEDLVGAEVRTGGEGQAVGLYEAAAGRAGLLPIPLSKPAARAI